MLADFANVPPGPDWADQYTANKRKYVDQPALQSFANQQDAFESGWFNKNFASALYDDGVKAVATGTAAHYPMLTSAISAINQNFNDNVDDVGFFALPAQNAENTRMTIWLPNAVYIPKTTEGAKLEAAKKFVAFFNSPDGCEIQNEVNTVTGPVRRHDLRDCRRTCHRWSRTCRRTSTTASPSPALEFVSPIKGPNLVADHRRGRLRHQVRRGRRHALRRGREEAGPAAGPRRLVTPAR